MLHKWWLTTGNDNTEENKASEIDSNWHHIQPPEEVHQKATKCKTLSFIHVCSISIHCHSSKTIRSKDMPVPTPWKCKADAWGPEFSKLEDSFEHVCCSQTSKACPLRSCNWHLHKSWLMLSGSKGNEFRTKQQVLFTPIKDLWSTMAN